MAKFGINDILNAKTKAAGQQAQTDGYKEIYLSPYEVTCGKQTLWEQRKAQRLKRGLQQCRKRQQQWKVYKTGKERGVAWAAP